MNLNHLRIFACVASAGSVTAAARRLRVSQPAVSKQLRELEQALGTALVDRLPRGVRLTSAGELLLLHATRIFASEAQAEVELGQLIGLARGRLSIGASTTIGSYLLPGLLGRFHRMHPEIRLELQIANTHAIQQAVLEASIDFGLTEGLVVSETLHVRAVSHDDMVAIAAPEHPLTQAAPVTVEQLLAEPFIAREQGSGTREVIENALAERGLKLEPELSLGSTEAVKNAVASGLGVAIVSRLAIELELSAGRLEQIDVQGFGIRRALHLVTLQGKEPSPAAAAFIQLLEAS